MIAISINPDRIDNDPIDRIIAEVRRLPGFIDVSKSLYYREWDIKFTFDGETATESELRHVIKKIVEDLST